MGRKVIFGLGRSLLALATALSSTTLLAPSIHIGLGILNLSHERANVVEQRFGTLRSLSYAHLYDTFLLGPVLDAGRADLTQNSVRHLIGGEYRPYLGTGHLPPGAEDSCRPAPQHRHHVGARQSYVEGVGGYRARQDLVNKLLPPRVKRPRVPRCRGTVPGGGEHGHPPLLPGPVGQRHHAPERLPGLARVNVNVQNQLNRLVLIAERAEVGVLVQTEFVSDHRLVPIKPLLAGDLPLLDVPHDHIHGLGDGDRLGRAGVRTGCVRATLRRRDFSNKGFCGHGKILEGYYRRFDGPGGPQSWEPDRGAEDKAHRRHEQGDLPVAGFWARVIGGGERMEDRLISDLPLKND